MGDCLRVVAQTKRDVLHGHDFEVMWRCDDEVARPSDIGDIGLMVLVW